MACYLSELTLSPLPTYKSPIMTSVQTPLFEVIPLAVAHETSPFEGVSQPKCFDTFHY